MTGALDCDGMAVVGIGDWLLLWRGLVWFSGVRQDDNLSRITVARLRVGQLGLPLIETRMNVEFGRPSSIEGGSGLVIEDLKS